MSKTASQPDDGPQPGQNRLPLSRRDTLKATAATVTVVALGIKPTVTTVAATDSGDPELSIDGEIPNESAVQITVDEFSSSTGSYNNRDVALFEGGDEDKTKELPGLDGDAYYEFEIELGTNNEVGEDGDGSPKIESLTLEIPGSDDDSVDEGSVDDDELDVDEDDITFSQRLGHVFGFDFGPFSRSADVDRFLEKHNPGLFGPIVDDDDDDGGWFDFDFWPFGEEDED